jgi:hypothetical protein
MSVTYTFFFTACRHTNRLQIQLRLRLGYTDGIGDIDECFICCVAG